MVTAQCAPVVSAACSPVELWSVDYLKKRFVDFLKKPPIRLAGEILLSLGPEVRDPSAYFTGKVVPHIGDAAVTIIGR